MNRIALIYDRHCPNVAVARRRIQEALSAAGLPPSWQEWDRDADETPAAVRPFGSPTILVDGLDVAAVAGRSGEMPSANSCRVYADGKHGIQGVPPLQLIITALKAGSS